MNPPKSTSASASPKPLRGMFILSNLSLLTAPVAISTLAILPSNIVVELTESVDNVGAVAIPVKAPAKIIVPEVVVVASGVALVVI